MPKAILHLIKADYSRRILRRTSPCGVAILMLQGSKHGRKNYGPDPLGLAKDVGKGFIVSVFSSQKTSNLESRVRVCRNHGARSVKFRDKRYLTDVEHGECRGKIRASNLQAFLYPHDQS